MQRSFRPGRDCSEVLPLVPSDESLGYYLSPYGLEWTIQADPALERIIEEKERKARGLDLSFMPKVGVATGTVQSPHRPESGSTLLDLARPGGYHA